ncbi:TcaA second domain-containing protein [Mammaliicoccus sciuri]|uniref:TcaA second domain-containing protein n=1 Tax=Mammaliicoccus sciuri TaxID=1296 RepID=UPI003F560287
MKNSAKFKVILTSTVLASIIIITLIIYFFISQNKATAQIDEFSNAVKSENYKELSQILSTNKTTISEKDAQAFVDYVKDRDHYDQFIKELNTVKKM